MLVSSDCCDGLVAWVREGAATVSQEMLDIRAGAFKEDERCSSGEEDFAEEPGGF